MTMRRSETESENLILSERGQEAEVARENGQGRGENGERQGGGLERQGALDLQGYRDKGES